MFCELKLKCEHNDESDNRTIIQKFEVINTSFHRSKFHIFITNNFFIKDFHFINREPRGHTPLDHLRYGFRSLESERGQDTHPVSKLQASLESEWDSKMDMVRRTYGTHMAMRLVTEKETFSRPHRLPGLQSSRTTLDTVLGTDSNINFSDFLSGTVALTTLRQARFQQNLSTPSLGDEASNIISFGFSIYKAGVVLMSK
eukprot:gene2095-4099_t